MARLVDCGDIPIIPFDNALSLWQMEDAYLELLSRRPHALSPVQSLDQTRPRLITLGGDHSIALPALRALRKTYQRPVAVLHFDAHLDTWRPDNHGSAWTSGPTQADFSHGSMFWLASTEGLILNTSVHAGLRCRLSGTDFEDYLDDGAQGFLRIESDDIDEIGIEPIISQIISRIGISTPVYLSVDIDSLDLAFAPGTGTPEPGGWTTRELIQILRGIEDLNLVGADLVEVSPAYDSTSEQTALAAAQIVYEILTSMVKRVAKDRGEWRYLDMPGTTWKANMATKC